VGDGPGKPCGTEDNGQGIVAGLGKAKEDKKSTVLVRLGFRVHVVREEEDWLSGVKKRSVAEGWIPGSAVGIREGGEYLYPRSGFCLKGD
jgi:hypothetical protein